MPSNQSVVQYDTQYVGVVWTINANCNLYIYKPDAPSAESKYIKLGNVDKANFCATFKQNGQQYNRVFKMEIKKQIGGYTEESQDIDTVTQFRIERSLLLLSENAFEDFNQHDSDVHWLLHKDILQQWSDCKRFNTMSKKKGSWFTYYFQSRAPPRHDTHHPSPPIETSIVPQQLNFGSSTPNPAPNQTLRPFTSPASSSSRDIPATPPIPTSQPEEQPSTSPTKDDEGMYIYVNIYTHV